MCRRAGFPGPGFWEPAERLTYFVLLPALLVITLAEADFEGFELLPMMATVGGSLVVVAVLAFAVRPFLRLDGPAFTSLVQALVRLNSYIGLSIAFGLFGEAGLAAAAVGVGTLVILGNLGSVLVLVRYGTPGVSSSRALLSQLATNPLILACLVGGLLQATGIGAPPVIGDMLRIVSRAALPLGLLFVGAALGLEGAAGARRAVLAACVLRLAVLPLITYAAAGVVGLEGSALVVAVLLNALPTATSSYVLAKLMGGDAPLMANLCAVQTLVSMASLPLVLVLVG